MANDPVQGDGRRPHSADGEAANLVIEQGSGLPLAGVDTDVLDHTPGRANRPIKKVGFIVNDTIEAAKVEAPRIAGLLHERGVEVTESHSASPDTTVNWTR
ncbi:MAG TPA: hypothetical protein VND68_01645, partial [Chloroflexia bacterium]|nr:hypothetical protein [Chloroflexia bacterium]